MSAPSGLARLLGTIAIVSGVFLSVLSSTILNVPLAAIAADLRVSIAAASLVVTAAAISFATMLPVGDWIGNRFGRRNVYCFAILGIGVTSVVCALAPNLDVLIATRIVQGASSALLPPLVMTLLADLYEPHRRPLALSAWAMANSAGQALGPPVGGVLTAAFGWRSIFLPLPIIALFAFAIALRTLPVDVPRTLPLEWRGAGSVTLGALLLLSAFSAVPTLGVGSPWLAALALAGVACIGAFVWSIRTTEHPFVSPAAFFEPSYRTGCIAVTAATVCFGSSLLAIPIYLMQGLAVPVAAAGFVTLTLPLAMLVTAPLSSVIVRRWGTGGTLKLALFALIVATASIAWAIDVHAGLFALFPAMILIGAAVAAAYTAGAVGTTQSEAGRYGAGIGFFNLLRASGFAFGAALVAVVLQARAGDYGAIFAITGALAVVSLGATFVSERYPIGNPT